MSERNTDELRICRSCGLKFLLTTQDLSEADTTDICPGCRALKRLARERHGAVKWFSPRRGYGFVRSDDGEEAFLHASSVPPRLRAALRPGRSVRYRVRFGERGPVADELDLSGQ